MKPGDTAFEAGGLRDFFLYRDLGVARVSVSLPAEKAGSATKAN